MLNKLRLRLRALFFKPELEDELEAEVRFHLERGIEENIIRGMTPEEARNAAIRSFGGVERVKEECRDVRGIRLLEELWQDLRYGGRMLLKRPGATTIVALSMALGIGANATIFSFVNELLLRPPAVERREELLEVWNHNVRGGSSFNSFSGLSYPEYEYYRDHNHVFSETLAWDGDPSFISWSRKGEGEIIQGEFVSGNFFSCLGVKAVLGRTFSPEEDRTSGTHPVVIISHSFWRERLGADPNVIGSTMMLNGFSLTIIGVAPKGFTGLMAGVMPDVWIPLMMGPQTRHYPELLTNRGMSWLFLVGRLRPGMNPTQARADMNLLANQFSQSYLKHDEIYEMEIYPVTLMPGPARRIVIAFSGLFMLVVALVLLIACANAA
ncbi:MAG: ABC transporter permease, partial [Blastocatellia bacterium]|nr:ABC transporter permease [Blastocatellia bacterium]